VGGNGLNSYVSTFHRRPLGGKSRFLAMARSYSADEVLESLEADLPYSTNLGFNQQQQQQQQQENFLRAGGTPLTNALEPPPPRHKLPPSLEVSDFWAAPHVHHHPLSERKTSPLHHHEPPSWQREYATYSNSSNHRSGFDEASLPLPAFSGGVPDVYNDEAHSAPSGFSKPNPYPSVASSSLSSSSHLSPPVLRGQRNALARVAAWSGSTNHFSPQNAGRSSNNYSGSGSFDRKSHSVSFSSSNVSASGSSSSSSSSGGGILRQRGAFASAAMSSLGSP